MTVVLTGEKKVKGRKRHMVTDTHGHMLHIKVHAANIHDTVGGCDVMDRTTEKFPSLKGVSADEGYRKTLENHVIQTLGLTIEISKKIKDGWAVLAKRWVVERTFAWINNYRRLSKDFEILTASAENMIRISMVQIMLDKLA